MAAAVTARNLTANTRVDITDIKRIAKTLAQLKVQDIKASQWNFLRTSKFFPMATSHGSSWSQQDILRRNLYFIARKTEKVSMLIVQLTQRTLLSLDAKEKLLALPDVDLVRAVTMYAHLLTIETHLYDRMLRVFDQYDNSKVADILRLGALKCEEALMADVRPPKPRPFIGDVSAVQSTSNHPSLIFSKSGHIKMPTTPAPFIDVCAAPKPELFIDNVPVVLSTNVRSSSWNCPHCTYANPIGEANVCEMCFKTRDYSLLTTSPTGSPTTEFECWEQELLRSCNHCTFLNSIDQAVCSICSNKLHSTDSIDSD